MKMEKRGKPKRPCISILTAFIALGVVALAGPRPAYASVMDQISVALLGHMETVVETKTNGKTDAEFLATPFQFGKIDGGYVFGIDGGVLGNVAPTSIGQAGYNWTAGVHFHLSPFLKKIMPVISPSYPALAALEINPRVSYLFRNHTNDVRGGWQVGLGIGWAFSASPEK